MTSIVKLRLRQDTASNWTSTNPILSAGEPGFETNTGYFKIGNGTSTWSQLPYQTNLGTVIPEVPTDGVLYGRRDGSWIQVPTAEVLEAPEDGATYVRMDGDWLSVVIPENDTRKTLTDLLQTAYDTELDMNYDIVLSDASTARVYGIRKHINIVAGSTIEDITTILSGVSNIIGFSGTIYAEGENDYFVLPVSSDNISAEIYLDSETNDVIIKSVSNNERTAAPFDGWVLYTKVTE